MRILGHFFLLNKLVVKQYAGKNMPIFTQLTYKSNNWTYELIIQLLVHFEQSGIFFMDQIPNYSYNLQKASM